MAHPLSDADHKEPQGRHTFPEAERAAVKKAGMEKTAAEKTETDTVVVDTDRAMNTGVAVCHFHCLRNAAQSYSQHARDDLRKDQARRINSKITVNT